MRHINIPISETDVRMFEGIAYHQDETNTGFSWVFKDDQGDDVQVNFMNEEEYEDEPN